MNTSHLIITDIKTKNKAKAPFGYVRTIDNNGTPIVGLLFHTSSIPMPFDTVYHMDYGEDFYTMCRHYFKPGLYKRIDYRDYRETHSAFYDADSAYFQYITPFEACELIERFNNKS